MKGSQDDDETIPARDAEGIPVSPKDRIIRAVWEKGCEIKEREGKPRPVYPVSDNDRELLAMAAVEGVRIARERLETLPIIDDDGDDLVELRDVEALFNSLLAEFGADPVSDPLVREREKDHSAGLIYQVASPLAETAPRPTCENTKSCREACEDVDGLNYCLKCGLWEGAR